MLLEKAPPEELLRNIAEFRATTVFTAPIAYRTSVIVAPSDVAPAPIVDDHLFKPRPVGTAAAGVTNATFLTMKPGENAPVVGYMLVDDNGIIAAIGAGSWLA